MTPYYTLIVYILNGFYNTLSFDNIKRGVDYSAIRGTEKISCGDSLCLCTTSVAICDGREKLSRYIPKLPKTIKGISYKNNYLPVINSTTMRNISELNLTILSLTNNGVISISSESFKHFSTLRTFCIEDDSGVKVDEVASALSCLKYSLHGVHFLEMSWEYLPENMFEILSEVKAIVLSSKIQRIEIKTSSVLRHLKEFILAENLLVLFDINRAALNHLEMLNLDENLLSAVPRFCNIKSQKSVVPKLRYFSLSNNKIYHISDEDFKCLPELILLCLKGNPLKLLGNNFLSILPSLRTLVLSNIGSERYILNMEQYALNSSTLETLYFSNFDLRDILIKPYEEKWLFNYSPNLQTLVLSSSLILIDERVLVSLFSPLINVKHLDISFNEIQILPDALFSQMASLTELLLRGNEIHSWNGLSVFENNKISFLDLRNNKISIINETFFPSSMLKTLEKSSLYLSNNPYLCTCKTLDSINWFRSHRHILNSYPYDYQCYVPSDVRGTDLEDYNPSPESCAEKDIALLVSIPVSIVSVATLSIILLVYKSRWRLRYGIFIFKNRYRSYEQIEGLDSFVYTGFVIYSDDDRNWVHNELLHRIEDQQGFRLCIRLRDFDVGKVHVDNIMENMLVSEKIIVVLSNNFAKDDWCQFQLLLAETRLLKQNVNILVLLMLEEIQSDCLRASLYKLVTERQYALWSQDETGNDLFWEQTLSQLRRPTVIN